jgi:hypothetical protein
MPSASAVTNLTAAMFEERANFAVRLRYGDATESMAHHMSLPLAIAALVQFGSRAVLYRFEDKEPGVVMLAVAFDVDAVDEVLCSSIGAWMRPRRSSAPSTSPGRRGEDVVRHGGDSCVSRGDSRSTKSC